MSEQTNELKKTVITIVSGKGGTGKTTTACNLGSALAILGRKILLVDADVGLKNIDIFLNMQEYVISDLCDLLKNESKPENTIINHPEIKNLFILPAALSRDKEEIDENEFLKSIRFLSKNYDYTIIDSPHGIGNPFKMTLLPAHKVIVMTTPEKSSVIKSDKIIGVAEDSGIDQKNISLVINKIENHLRKDNIQLSTAEIIDIMKLKLLSEIPFDYDIYISNEEGASVTTRENLESSQIFFNMARIIDGEALDPHIVKEGSFLSGIFGN